MRLGIMQPYFFPYLGYFSLMAATDRWIVFDTPQFIRKGWVHRNRVLKKGEGDWKYIRIPIAKCPQETPINEVLLDNSEDWQDQLLRNLDYYRDHHAPHYAETLAFLKNVFALEEPNLARALVHFLQETCAYVGLDVQMEVFSEMAIPLGPVTHPGEWALRISEVLGARTYINPPGGRDIFDLSQFEASGIELRFLTAALPPYNQRRPTFVPGLSILDVLMWNSRPRVLEMIRDYSLSI